MFGWEYPPHITGGLGTACQGLTRGLAKHNVDVTFVLPKLFGDEANGRMQFISAEQVGVDMELEEVRAFSEHVRFLAVDSFLHPYLGSEDISHEWEATNEHTFRLWHWSRGNVRFSGTYGRDLIAEVNRYAVIAAAIAKRVPHDVIHAHDWLTYLAGVAAHKVSGKPLVVHVHATEFDRSGENVNQTVYDIERFGMTNASKVVCVSYMTRNIVINRYGVPADRVHAIHNAVDFSGEASGERIIRPFSDQVVTFLGRITFQKGPDYFVEAAHCVLSKMDNVRFVMAGSGDMRNRMVRRVAELGIASRFHFAGFLKGEEVSRMYRMSDVYVMPSVSEPFGITPLEAMRSQVPVIISKQSGVSEVLKYALKVDFWDVDALSDAIYGLLNYRALSSFFQHYGSQEVTTLKWSSAARRVLDVYQSLV